MNLQKTAAAFEALASEHRLAILRLLAAHPYHGLVAGDIGKTLDIPPTNLSFHLKTLTDAGLTHVERQGRFLRYRADAAPLRAAIADMRSVSEGRDAPRLAVSEQSLPPAPAQQRVRRRID